MLHTAKLEYSLLTPANKPHYGQNRIDDKKSGRDVEALQEVERAIERIGNNPTIPIL